MAAILGGRLWIVKPNQRLEADRKPLKKTGNVEGNIFRPEPVRLDRFFDYPLMSFLTVLIRSSPFFHYSPGPHNGKNGPLSLRKGWRVSL